MSDYKNGNVCGDNRFEIIAKAKQDILDATNIENSPKEMEVLDGFLFRHFGKWDGSLSMRIKKMTCLSN